MKKLIIIVLLAVLNGSMSCFRGGAARVTAHNGGHGGHGSTGGLNQSIAGYTGGTVYSPQAMWGGYSHIQKSSYAPSVYRNQQSAWCTVDRTSRKR